MPAIVRETSAVADPTKTPSIANHDAGRMFPGRAIARIWRVPSFIALIGIWLSLEFHGIFSPDCWTMSIRSTLRALGRCSSGVTSLHHT
jgi:hypothetical protein